MTSIPVALMRLKNTNYDGPGIAAASQIRNGDAPKYKKHENQARHTIEYLPGLRSFRVIFRAPKREMETRMIPEGAVLDWEPLGELPEPQKSRK